MDEKSMKNDVVKTSLTETEQAEATVQEKIVDDGMAGYVVVGDALGTIRDRHLFVGPFKQYVEKRFEIAYFTANRRIVAARVALTLKAAGLPIPANQDQAYQLHELTPENQVKTWQEIAHRAKQARITTKLILDVLGKKRRQPRTTKPESPTAASEETLPTQVGSAAETVEKVTPASSPVVRATQAVGKAVANLQIAFGVLEGAEVTGSRDWMPS